MKWTVVYQDWVSLEPEVSLIYHDYIWVRNLFEW